MLRHLNGNATAAMENRMRTVVTKPEHLLPVRISCYYTGALVINGFRLQPAQ